MADRVQKFLLKLTGREHDMITAAILDIITGNLSYLDIKPLKGYPKHYRVRKGQFRIIFKTVGDANAIVDVCRRDDQTYSNF
jgi:mRNA-degrading endonuclease RelE of RelBE toxin-antitoxin system